MSEGTIQPAGGGAASATYRCFLFADLRGYTAFIERAGNSAGLALLDDYLAITRAAVAQHHGAEIKTEGDGFYAVFPSASGAILCGLDIVRGAGEASVDRPERPIRVGVGINAGEAIQTADGYVGSAVNLAARVCATAGAGEVLVTDTVRGIARASIPVGFTSRGRRRLKGVADPVELFAVSSEGAPRVSDRRPGRWVFAAGGLLVAGLALTAVFALRPQAPGASGSPSPSAGPPALTIGSLDLGPYVADQFQPPFELVIADTGWSAYRIGPELVGFYHASEPQGHVDLARLDGVFMNACSADGPTVATGSTPLELIRALESVPYLSVGEPATINLGGHTGVSSNVDISEGALAACGSFGAGEVSVFPVGPETWRAHPGERVRIEAVDVEGVTVAALLSAEAAAASSVAELEQFFELADRLLEQLAF